MATIKQKIAARKIAETIKTGANLTGAEIVESSGYGKSMGLWPSRVLKSKGVRDELKELGFSIDGADSVIQKLLYGGKKEETRIKAAQEVYKRLGAYEQGDGGGNTYNTVVITSDQAARVARRTIARLQGGAQSPDRLPDSDERPV